MNRMFPMFLHTQCTKFTIIITSALGTPLNEMYINLDMTVIRKAKNFIKLLILLIQGFKVPPVKISQIHTIFLVNSILSVITYKQITRTSGRNSVVMSTSMHGADRAESNALKWLTASEISVMHHVVP